MAMKSSSFKPVRATEEDVKEINEQIDTEIKEAEEEKKAEIKPAQAFPDEKLLKDIDMEEFFFNGLISYTFKMGRIDIKMKVLTSQELQEVQSYLWKLRNDDISAIEAQLKYTVAILSRAILMYGKQDLKDMKLEEKETFINAMPSMLIPVLYDKYLLLEASASKAFENGGGELKN